MAKLKHFFLNMFFIIVPFSIYSSNYIDCNCDILENIEKNIDGNNFKKAEEIWIKEVQGSTNIRCYEETCKFYYYWQSFFFFKKQDYLNSSESMIKFLSNLNDSTITIKDKYKPIIFDVIWTSEYKDLMFMKNTNAKTKKNTDKKKYFYSPFVLRNYFKTFFSNPEVLKRSIKVDSVFTENYQYTMVISLSMDEFKDSLKFDTLINKHIQLSYALSSIVEDVGLDSKMILKKMEMISVINNLYTPHYYLYNGMLSYISGNKAILNGKEITMDIRNNSKIDLIKLQFLKSISILKSFPQVESTISIDVIEPPQKEMQNRFYVKLFFQQN